MNSVFRRAHAIDSAESLAAIVVIHLTLIAHFPKHGACSHWKKEIDGFIKAFKKLDNGKKGAHNFTEGYLTDLLKSVCSGYEERETIVSFIENAKDMPIGEVEDIDWQEVDTMIEDFSHRVLT